MEYALPELACPERSGNVYGMEIITKNIKLRLYSFVIFNPIH